MSSLPKTTTLLLLLLLAFASFACVKSQTPVDAEDTVEAPVEEPAELRYAEVRIDDTAVEVDGVRYLLPFELIEAGTFCDGGSVSFTMRDGEGKPVEFVLYRGLSKRYPDWHLFWGSDQVVHIEERRAVAISDRQQIYEIFQIAKTAFRAWMDAHVPNPDQVAAGVDRRRGMEVLEGTLVIIGLWATDETRAVDAQKHVETLRTAVGLYWVKRHGKCPSLDDLDADGLLFSRKVLSADPWGNPYVIECVGEEDAVVTSFGPDGERGTEDDIVTGPSEK